MNDDNLPDTNLAEVNPVLSIKNLSKSFGALKASDSVTLDLRKGEIHALIGPNGAGKSTLIKQIAGQIRQDRGEIYFGEQEITPFSPAQRAKQGLARSFQISSIIASFTALQNVMLAVQAKQNNGFKFFAPVLKNENIVELARSYLDIVDMAERAAIITNELSHGERRKLEIAMALALKPKVFLLDEPMAGMGSEGAKTLTHLLADLKKQAPILLVEHDMDAVFALADRISVLVYGRVIITGSVADIRSDPQVREAYLGSDGA